MLLQEQEARAKLASVHQTLSLKHGQLTEEYEEQLMATMCIPPDARVLEIGGNVGRNSCVIARLLNDSTNLVVVESDPQSVEKLVQNRDANGLHFAVVDAAISKIPLVQNSWDTRPLRPENASWFPVKTVEWSTVKDLHGHFDTFVLDCEGAFYYILKEEPTVLDGIKRVCIENDFHQTRHKDYVAQAMRDRGFECKYSKQGGFYEVWERSTILT